MEIILFFVDFIIYIDKYLINIIDSFGPLTYFVLFGVIFAETGFVVTPFLPGDSLLFAAGSFAPKSILDPFLLFLTLSLAAVLGDTVNYWIGSFFGARAFKDDSRFFKKKYLDRTHKFYEKHGGKTIILARFIPIIRTFAPFVAGVAKMNYFWFLTYNVFGALLWVGLFVFAGFYFGNIEFVQKNFSLVIIVIILLSLLPGLIEYFRQRRNAKKSAPT